MPVDLSLRRFLRHPVRRNAAVLYALQLTSFALPLVTIPYLARVLGPAVFGRLIFFQAFALWASVLMEYGFNFYASREVARHRGDSRVIGVLAADVQGAKVLLLGVMSVLVGLLYGIVPLLRENPVLLGWGLLQALAFGLSPFWYFQGTEKLVGAVGLETGLRFVGTLGVFVMVKDTPDGWKALALQATTGMITTVLTTAWMYREVGVYRMSLWRSIRLVREGWNMFLFKGAQNVYGSVNAFLLGLLAGPLAVGYFGGAEKIFKALSGLLSPIVLALYPRVSRLAVEDPRQGVRVFVGTAVVAGVVGLTLALGLVIAAPLLVKIVLGQGYEPAAAVLRTLAIAIPFNFVSSTVITLRLLPARRELAAGRVVWGGLVVDLILIALLAPRFGHHGAAWAVAVAELTIAFGAVWHVLRKGVDRLL